MATPYAIRCSTETRGGGIVDGRPIDALGKILFGFVWSLARYPVPTLGAILVAAPVLNFGRALGFRCSSGTRMRGTAQEPGRR